MTICQGQRRPKKEFLLNNHNDVIFNVCLLVSVALNSQKRSVQQNNQQYSTTMLLVLALRIHVSSQCKSLLDDIGGYHTEERGWTSMKVRPVIIVFV